MDFADLEVAINYKFKNRNILVECLTHPSMNDKNLNYERLEFLGDSVLNLIITEFLVKQFKLLSEGDLAKKRAYLVSGSLSTKIARRIDLGKYIIMSNSERKSGGIDKSKNLENVVESLIGSIYLDGDFDSARKVVLFLWQDYLNIDISAREYNPKSYLQEWALAKNYKLPVYILRSQTGTAHQPIFEVEASVELFGHAVGYGKSKKEAEIDAAKNLINGIE